MQNSLEGKTIAILATDGFEEVELVGPRNALELEGAKTELVSPKEGVIQGMNHMDKGAEFPIDRLLTEAHANDDDGRLLPGGVAHPDMLRSSKDATRFVREFFEQRKPVAAICHGPWMLVEAGLVQGRTLTSWPSLATDVRNAGGRWVDKQVVVENGVVTSRKPDDIDAFNKKMIEEFAEGAHAARKAS